MLFAAAPAHADQGSADGISVSVDDVVLTGYSCTTTTVTVRTDVADWAGWTAAVVGGPAGGGRLDAVGFGGRGPATMTGSLLICPADSVGPWTVSVDTRVVLTQSKFTVGFTVEQVPTSTVIDTARLKASSVRVRGSVLGHNGVRPRGPVAIRGLRKGKWRALGHTYPRPSGTFRFVAPRNVTRVRAEYGGDTVTEKSQARARVERISTSSSS
jgi:hypothetical protein